MRSRAQPSKALRANVPRALGCMLLGLAGAACEQPDEPEAEMETVYLLDAIDGQAPPAPVCEGASPSQVLRFESVALFTDGSYGRLQESQFGGDPPVQQEERGEYERVAAAILLRNAMGAVTTLSLLDSAGVHVRRIHTCGDTLRYVSVPIITD